MNAECKGCEDGFLRYQLGDGRHGHLYSEVNAKGLDVKFLCYWEPCTAIPPATNVSSLSSQAIGAAAKEAAEKSEVRWLIDDGVMCLGNCGARLKFVVYTSPDAMRFRTKEEAEGAILEFRGKLGDHPVKAMDHMFCGGSPTAPIEKKTTKFREQWTVIPNLSYTKCDHCEATTYYRTDDVKPNFCCGCGAAIILQAIEKARTK